MTSSIRLMALVFFLALGTAYAEIAPGEYAKMREAATEKLIVEVTGVSKKASDRADWSETTVKAKVLHAEASNSNLKPGQEIEIRFKAFDFEKGKMTPGVWPNRILKIGEVVPAYLNWDKIGKCYSPAAHGESFVLTQGAERSTLISK